MYISFYSFCRFDFEGLSDTFLGWSYVLPTPFKRYTIPFAVCISYLLFHGLSNFFVDCTSRADILISIFFNFHFSRCGTSSLVHSAFIIAANELTTDIMVKYMSKALPLLSKFCFKPDGNPNRTSSLHLFVRPVWWLYIDSLSGTLISLQTSTAHVNAFISASLYSFHSLVR